MCSGFQGLQHLLEHVCYDTAAWSKLSFQSWDELLHALRQQVHEDNSCLCQVLQQCISTYDSDFVLQMRYIFELLSGQISMPTHMH